MILALTSGVASADRLDAGLLLVRVYAGFMIFRHGYAHVWPNKIAGTAKWFGSMGMRPPLVQAWLASITELGSAVLLAAGFLTSLGAAGLLGVMAVAFWIEHRRRGFFIYLPGQGWEYVVMIATVAVLIGTVGPGRFSVDHAMDLSLFNDWKGLIVTLAGGLGGAALLLATCWTDPKKRE
jgi:putative oxidoreductase